MLPLQNSRQFGLITLLTANIVTIVLFFIQSGSIIQVLWVYWFQSVIIGVINVIRILQLPTGIIPGQSFKGISFLAIKISIAGFFVSHYGFFHFGYALFLYAFSSENFTASIGTDSTRTDFGTVTLSAVLLSGIAFALHHAITYISERTISHEVTIDPINIFKRVLIRPYSRIIPMHITIILGPIAAVLFGTSSIFILFMVLKTIIDVVLYQKGTSHSIYKVQTLSPNALPISHNVVKNS